MPTITRGLSFDAAALFALGLRPFYLAAAGFAALAVPAWFAAYRGWLVLDAAVPAVAWHAHEMLFAFAPAVICGFLLAAVRNWTSLPTPTGIALISLLSLWVAGRISMLSGPPVLAMIIDGAFLPALAVILGAPIWRARNFRNMFVPVILTMLALANLAFHAAHQDPDASVMAPVAIRVAADTIALLMAVIAGRIIPAFAANAIDGFRPLRRSALEAAAIGSLVLIALMDIGSLWWEPPAAMVGPVFMVAAAAHLARAAGWKPWAMRHQLLLAILPLSYLWIPAHLLLRARPTNADLDLTPLALHALVIGAMGGLMLAMMTRSALGHTGRALIAGTRETLIYLSIHAAAVMRVVFPWLWPERYAMWVGAAALLWTVAFAAFAIGYWPILTRPRADGQPG